MLGIKENKERYALGIIRVSSDEQARKGTSLESQEEWIRKIARQMKLELVKIIKETISGETFPKKYFDKILNMVEKEDIEYILVYSLDRLARNLPYGAFLLERLYELGKIKIVTSTGIFDLNNRNDRAQVWFSLLMAEMEQGSREERTVRGMITKLKRSEWPFSPPFGYEIIDGKIRLLPTYKPVIIYIFETFLKTKSYAETARLTNEKYGKLMNFELTPNKVKKIVGDRTYLGYLRWNGMLFGEGDENKPREELRVINEEIFDKARAIARSISRRYARNDAGVIEKLIEEYGVENVIDALNLRPICYKCGSSNTQKNGKEKNQLKFSCRDCGYQFRVPSKKQLKMLKESSLFSCPVCNSKEKISIKIDGDFLELRCMECGYNMLYKSFRSPSRTIKKPKIKNRKRRLILNLQQLYYYDKD